MRRLIRNPLTWMVLAEVVVVCALVIVAWSSLSSMVRPGLVSPSPPAVGAASQDNASSPSPDLPEVAKTSKQGPLPGLNVDPAFWRSRLDLLNRDQVFFEQLEWRIVHSAMDTAQRYVDTVVLPSVRRAEGSGS
jgi:hypothetical protein